MKYKSFKSLIWITKLQWNTSKLSFFWGIFNSAFAGLKPIAQTYALAGLFASVSAAALQKADPSPVYLWLLALLMLELLGQTIFNLDSIARNRFQQKMELASNEHFFNKLYTLSQEQFDNEEFNTKLDRARDGMLRIWVANIEIYSAVTAIITFVGSITAILLASPLIGGLIIISVIPTIFLRVRQNRLRETMYRQTVSTSRVAYRTRWLLVDPNQMPEIRLMHAFKKLINAWRSHMKKSQDLEFKNSKHLLKYDLSAEVIQPLVSFGANVYFFRLLLLGSIGLDRFIFLRGMLEQAVMGATSLSGSVQHLHELSLDLQNFSEIYETPPAIKDGSIKLAKPITIEFRNVSFSYPGSDKLVLNDFSLVMKAGSKLALVGENGAGKSTIIKLLLRQYLPTSGTILVNDTDIKDIQLESYYELVSNLSQEFMLIDHLTIRDNLLIGIQSNVSDSAIRVVTDLVGASEFIDKLPNGLNTRLDKSFDDGTNLSGGQKQRLAIARALLSNGDLMILDEPTSAIDAKAEYSILNNIYKKHAGKTTLIVSHRFSSVRKADTIIVLDEGKVLESGTHEELINNNGLYKEMFEVQAEGYR